MCVRAVLTVSPLLFLLLKCSIRRQSDSAARSAAKAKLDALGRMKAAAVAGGKAHGNKFVPFPDHARYIYI